MEIDFDIEKDIRLEFEDKDYKKATYVVADNAYIKFAFSTSAYAASTCCATAFADSIYLRKST